jgi:C-terminal processing protease CtpA/Prc
MLRRFVASLQDGHGSVSIRTGEPPRRYLLLDLRGNGGGTDWLGIRLSQHLRAEPLVYFRLSSRTGAGWRRPGGSTYRTEEGVPTFHGRLLAITDECCSSATDNFLRCMRDLHPRFTVVGRPTGGGTGAPRSIVTLKHSGAAVTLCTLRVYGPSSGLTEGRGTTPDVAVTWMRGDFLTGRDPDLEAALRVLEK